MNASDNGRIEHDALGEVTVTAEALYGVNTVRGCTNFPLGGPVLGHYPRLVRALLQVKLAAAQANRSLGAVPDNIGQAIESACQRLINDLGAPDAADTSIQRFPVPILEGSGGTSINMNINEVVANAALAELGLPLGSYDVVHPNDHVNRCQSTNDVVPAALALAVHDACHPAVDALRVLGQLCRDRAEQWSDVLRTGRTCLQPAQPMTLGQAFGGYATGIIRAADRLEAQSADLLSLPLGATAIGTGLGAVPGYRSAVIDQLGQLTGLPVTPVPDYFDGTQSGDNVARVSAELRTASGQLARLAADLVLLSSDASGQPEIRLPSVQAGSSIMPGKVNPVIPIMVRQVAYAVFGNDSAVALAAADGQLELNHFEPLLAQRVLESADLVANASLAFAQKCVAGIEPDEERSRDNLVASPAIATAVAEHLGYARTSQLVKAAAAEGRSFIDVAVDEGVLDGNKLDEMLMDAATALQGEPEPR